jgi:uncharacterized membrane protein YidH (DUF202 family)
MASVSGDRPAHVNVQGDEPAWWQQYRKAILVAAVGLLAFLTDLATSRATDGEIDWLHAMIVLVSTLLSTGGVAAVGNVYSRGQLEAKLAALPPAGRS